MEKTGEYFCVLNIFLNKLIALILHTASNVSLKGLEIFPPIGGKH